MKLLKILSVLVALAGAVALAVLLAPYVLAHVGSPALAQGKPDGSDRARIRSEMHMMLGAGAWLGVSVRDVESGESDRQKLSGGVVIEDVQPDSPASRAGLKRSDVIVEFDGERVRSASQFARLVRETPAGRTVKATIVRDGQRSDLQLTPFEGRGPDVFINGDRLRDRIDTFVRRLPELNFDFDLDAAGLMAPRARLGVTVEGLTSQLAGYFGAKDGVLVTAVTEGSAAEKARLKAGDVITTVNGSSIRSPQELTQALRRVDDDSEITIGIVRDKKESSVKAKLESTRMPRSARPI